MIFVIIGRETLGANTDGLSAAVSRSIGAKAPKSDLEGQQSFPRKMTTMVRATLVLSWRFARGAASLDLSSTPPASGGSWSAA